MNSTTPNDENKKGECGAINPPITSGGASKHEDLKNDGLQRGSLKAVISRLQLTDWITSTSSLFIAVATGFNVYYVGGQLNEMRTSGAQTDQLIRSNSRLAESVAMAARLSAQTQLPRIALTYISQYVKTSETTSDYINNTMVKDSYAGFGLRNTGGGPAFLVDCIYGYEVANIPPTVPTYPKRCDIRPGATIPSGGALEQNGSMMHLKEEQVDAINSGAKTLWVWTKVVVGDVLGNKTEIGIIARWVSNRIPDASGQPWAQAYDPNYTYYRSTAE